MAKNLKAKDSASVLYGIQNKLFHRAFDKTGMPYSENKDHWLDVISQLVKRKPSGLSELNLAERSAVISHLAKTVGDLFNPHVPRHWSAWTKGDPEPKGKYGQRPMHVPKYKAAMVSKVHAILADLKLPWAYVDKISHDRFNVDFVEWLKADELHAVVQMMVIYQKRQKSRGVN